MKNSNSQDKIEGAETRQWRILIILAIFHLPLGILFYNSSLLSLIHPAAVFFAGLYYAWRKDEDLSKVAIITSYLIGSEVLWRMSGSAIFWEFGKYGTSVIFLVALWRRNCLTPPILPLVYFLLLLPSCLMILNNPDLSQVRSQLSSTMSGPVLLFVSCWFFSYLKVNRTKLGWMLLAIILPLISTACTTLFYTVSTPDLVFGDESNAATSGGFGPNQVSSALGLGVLAAFLCLVVRPFNLKFKIFLVGALLLTATQSALTFSRGGLYNAAGAIIIILLIMLWDKQRRMTALKITAGIALLLVLVFPFVNNFTGGALGDRFQDTDPTHRDEIAEADLEIWANNPIFGVGVGNAYEARREYLARGAMAHTEFARMVSEHGVFGFFATVILFLMTTLNFTRQKLAVNRAFVAACIVWSFLLMLNAAMRLAAPAYILGLSFTTILAIDYQPFNYWRRKIQPDRQEKILVEKSQLIERV